MLVSVKGCTRVTAGWSRLINLLIRMIWQFSTIYSIPTKSKKKKKKHCILFTPMERTRVKLHDSSRHFFARLYVFVVWFWVFELMGTAAEDDLTRVALRPAAGVPFDWLSIFCSYACDHRSLCKKTFLPPTLSPVDALASLANHHFIIMIQT